jgi:hypothetical protein
MNTEINYDIRKAIMRIQKTAENNYRKHSITEEEAEKRLREALIKGGYTRF